MTKQEILDKQWDWFITQDQPFGMGPNNDRCKFRGEGGSRCAIGLLISDEEYDPNMEGMMVSRISDRLGWDSTNLINILLDTMGAHDFSARMGSKKEFILQMRVIAERYDLVVPAT